MFSKGSKIMGPAAAVAFICFFLPWVAVSCAGQPVKSMTGMDLATQWNETVAYIVPLGALVVLGLVFAVFRRWISARTGAIGAIAASGATLLVLVARILSIRSQMNSTVGLEEMMSAFPLGTGDLGLGGLGGLTTEMVKITPQIGLWGVALANVAIIVGAVLDLFEQRGGGEMRVWEMEQWSMSSQQTDMVTQSTLPPAPPAPPPLQRTRKIEEPLRAMAWLVVQSGPYFGKQFGLAEGRNIIGRDGSRCDFVLDDELVSGQHAQIRLEGGQFVLYDLASTNGTFVNNRRIQRQMLMDNDVIRIGNTSLVFKSIPKPKDMRS